MSALAAAEVERIAPILDGPGARRTIQELKHRVKSELARELHDQVAQQLTTMLIQLQMFARAQQDRPDVMDHLSFIHASTREVLNNIRQILCDLRGQPPFALEFVESIRDELLPGFSRKTGVTTTLSVSPAWPAVLPPETCIHIYRIIQEAITNANKHGAAANVHVVLKAKGDAQLVVTVRDDGRGISSIGDARPVGVGILGMKERVALLGGVLQIRNRSLGGTTLTATFPGETTRWKTRTAKSAS